MSVLGSEGRFIVVEGPDAVGKETQCNLLKEAFEAAGREVEMFSFHRYDTEIGKMIKAFLKGEIVLANSEPVTVTSQMVMNAPNEQIDIHPVIDVERAPWNAMMFQALASVDKFDGADEILDIIHDGGIVICDRWWQSAVTYGTVQGLDGDWLKRIHGCLPGADVNVLIEIPVEESRRRKPIPDDKFEADQKMQVDVREAYRQLWDEARLNYDEEDAPQVPDTEWVIVDGTGTEQQVHERIMKAGDLARWL